MSKQTYIILLRGVNVGGNNILPMKELKRLLQANGYENVSTYIQSGNIVLTSVNHPAKAVAEQIEQNFGFYPEVMVLTDDELHKIIERNPYKEFEGKFVHFYLCNETPNVNIELLKRLLSSTECYEIHGNVFYLHAPDGVGRSKLIANIEKCLGISATGRNLNTMNTLESMLSIS